MRIRELLKVVLWSKKTTWKIASISALLILAIILGWSGYERYWISSGLRQAGRKALAQIDILQALSKTCNANFETKANLANREIELADQNAHTDRDFDVLFQLTNYLASTRIGHLRACKGNAFERQHERLKEFDNKLISSESAVKRELHRELD